MFAIGDKVLAKVTIPSTLDEKYDIPINTMGEVIFVDENPHNPYPIDVQWDIVFDEKNRQRWEASVSEIVRVS